MPPQTALKYNKKLAFASRSPYLLDMPVPLTIIGLGPVGQTLARAINRAGFHNPTLIGRGRPGERALARALKARYLPDLRHLIQGNGFIIICVKDNQITSAARQLARLKLDWKRLIVLHASGVFGSDVLKPLAATGASVAAWHPYMTFPKGGSPVGFGGVTFGISGEVRAVRAANRLTRALGGKPLKLHEEDRVLYHLSAVLACGFVAADLEMAVRVLKKIGLSERRALETILPIASQTLKNVRNLGPRRALTGPAVRGDKETIRKHLRALRKLDPKLAHVYATVSRHQLSADGQRPPVVQKN